MSQQSVRQAARRSALDTQAVLRKERADRERRLEGLAVAVLAALGERDAAVRDADDDHRGGPVAAGGGRVVRRWRAYGAGGDSATPTRARAARRQRPMSARRIHRLWPFAQPSERPRWSALWPRRSASSSTAWSVEAPMRSRVLQTPLREREVAELVMLKA
jgi:hypothetical protein